MQSNIGSMGHLTDGAADSSFADQQRSPEPCDLCGGRQFELIARRDRHGKPLDTAICRDCGLVRHWRLPEPEELARFYAQEYRQSYHGETTPGARRVMRAWHNGQRILRELSPHVRSGGSVFEVGAGIGCTVKVFEQAGFCAAGIEPHQGFQSFSRERIGADVEQGDLFDLHRWPTHDLVLLVHVIEHLRSPSEALRHIHGLLRPDGCLYVECPNLAAPFATRSRLFHYAHIHNFTPSSLIMTAEKAGYRLRRLVAGADEPNLQMLFSRVDTRQLKIDPHNYSRTLEAIARYSALAYHLRFDYLIPRAAKLVSYAQEYLLAPLLVPRLLARCQIPAIAPAAEPSTTAADPQTVRFPTAEERRQRRAA